MRYFSLYAGKRLNFNVSWNLKESPQIIRIVRACIDCRIHSSVIAYSAASSTSDEVKVSFSDMSKKQICPSFHKKQLSSFSTPSLANRFCIERAKIFLEAKTNFYVWEKLRKHHAKLYLNATIPRHRIFFNWKWLRLTLKSYFHLIFRLKASVSAEPTTLCDITFREWTRKQNSAASEAKTLRYLKKTFEKDVVVAYFLKGWKGSA